MLGLVKGRKDKKNLSEKVKKKISNSTTKLKNWPKLEKKKKKRQKLCKKKLKNFVLNGHCAVPVNTTLEFILKHNLYGYAFECVYQLFE